MKQNFEWVGDFKDGFAKVQLLDNTYNFIDRHGNLLSKQNFKLVYDFQDDFARVKLSDGTYNLLDRQGNLLSKEQTFKWVYKFKDGLAKVELSDGTYNFIDTKGNLLSKEQNFKWIDNFQDGFVRAQLSDGTYNLLDRQGNLLSKQNFKWVGDFEDGFTIVQLLNGTWYCIDKDLNFYDYESKTPVSTLFNETLARLNKFYGVELKLKSNLENIDLNELERRLDKALEKETPESLITWLNTQRTMNVIKNSEWKVDTCSQGESCWCRTILLKNEKLDFEGKPIYVAPSGAIDKEIAEYIVNLHNKVINRV